MTGTPTIVMSTLTGEVVWAPSDTQTWLRRMAELLPALHATPLSPQLRGWHPYPPTPGMAPPPWSKHQYAWELALELYHGAPPPSDRVFVHRDFHPGNLLWTGDVITGVVDWVSSCAGPPEEDVSHCRVNIAQHHGVSEADRFLRVWQDITGRREYHPYWDLTNVVSMVTAEPDERLDQFVAAAAAQLR